MKKRKSDHKTDESGAWAFLHEEEKGEKRSTRQIAKNRKYQKAIGYKNRV